MNAKQRVLKAINHEEPDRVPAFEITITNEALKKYYDIPSGTNLGELYRDLSKMGKMGNKLLLKNYLKQDIVKGVMRPLYEYYHKAKLDITLSMASLFPRELLKGGEGFIDEYGRILKFESYTDKEGNVTNIGGYYGGVFKSFEDFESWEQPDPNWEARYVNFEAGREVEEEMNYKVF